MHFGRNTRIASRMYALTDHRMLRERKFHVELLRLSYLALNQRPLVSEHLRIYPRIPV